MSEDFARFAVNHLSDTHLNVPTEYPPADLGRIKFRDGEGGDMPRLWAEYMLHQWWSARDSKLTFAEAVKRTTVHFMVGEP